jgi:hypothetical protein
MSYTSIIFLDDVRYSFRNSSLSPQVYLSFSFPGVNGWVHQTFHEISYTKPAADVWKLPDVCTQMAEIPSCGFFEKVESGLGLFGPKML